VSGIDWMGTPMKGFLSMVRKQADGTAKTEVLPHGDGVAQRLVGGIFNGVEHGYDRLLSEKDRERAESDGKVPLVRDGQKTYETSDRWTLGDLPAILETLSVLEEDHRRREREEAERKAAERKEREKVRAKERRKLKKLGEW